MKVELMNPIGKVTEEDVARLAAGAVEAPEEFDRILAAIESDPKLDVLYSLLAVKESDEVPELPFALPDLGRTRLCRVRAADGQNLLDDGTHLCNVEYEAEGAIRQFELRCETVDGELQVNADWPDGVKPIGFVLGNFDLAAGRTGYRKVLPPPVAPTTAFDEPLVARGDTRSFAAAADSGKVATDPTFFNAGRDGEQLWVRARLPREEASEPLVVETETAAKERRIGLVNVERTGAGTFFDATVAPFWKGTDVLAAVTVRALSNDEVPLLDREQVSWLLSKPERFAAVPIMDDENGNQNARFRYDSQKAAANDPDVGWFIRVQEGGAA